MKFGVVAALVGIAIFLGSSVSTKADAGVFTGNGQNLHQISSKTIQLLNIDVTIVLGRGMFLFDGGVPGMDRAQYLCTFELRNLSDTPEDVLVGFPIDSEFARQQPDQGKQDDSRDWVLDYSFIARDEGNTYHVKFVRRKPQKGTGEFSSIFVWTMKFAPRETRKLTVQYQIPMSMGLVSTTKEGSGMPLGSGVLSEEIMDIGMLDMAGYITSTGSSWAGDVKSATFTVITAPFERYLARRGMTEESLQEMKPEEIEQAKYSLPVRHPWWFRQIEPDGWQAIKGGVQWKYKDFKPKDALEVRYYMTQLPQRPEEVDGFVDALLHRLGAGESAEDALRQVREVLLATYGKAPDNEVVKKFVSQQIWYAPQSEFKLSSLTLEQSEVLKKLESRITAAGTK